MKVLFVYPNYPDTFWSFRYALKFISKKASFPPLGLLTVAAMLPQAWDKRLIDLNVHKLKDQDLEWADYVYVSAMAIQGKSAQEVIARAKAAGKKVVAGGPYFSTEYESIMGVDHFILDEAEITLPPFLVDLAEGNAKPLYRSDKKPDMSQTPVPDWSLIDMRLYSSMNIQFSRGCPFNCEFCDIVVLFGRKPRTKSKEQIIAELDAMYDAGWRSGVFFVDDNLIGNKRKLKEEILPSVIEWQEKKHYPFVLSTEASINIADDEELLELLTKAGFDTVFIGIETPNPESLAECDKIQNKNRDLVAEVKKLQQHGLQVQGGFIIGFDNDPASIFKSQIDFIQHSGIVTAMVGLLNAPPGTRLFKRLKAENRLLGEFAGDNTDCSLNFVPKMNRDALINGYQKVISTIYTPKVYYERLKTFLGEYHPRPSRGIPRFGWHHIAAFFRSVWHLGIVEKERIYYWRLLFFTSIKKPRSFPLAVTFSIFGYHFRKTSEKYIRSLASNATPLVLPPANGTAPS